MVALKVEFLINRLRTRFIVCMNIIEKKRDLSRDLISINLEYVARRLQGEKHKKQF